MANLLGGFTEMMDATEDIQKLCDQVKGQVEEKMHATYKKFIAVKYKSQVVAGQIFLVKVQVGGYLHLKVLQKLSSDGGEIVLLDVQKDLGKDDPIESF